MYVLEKSAFLKSKDTYRDMLMRLSMSIIFQPPGEEVQVMGPRLPTGRAQKAWHSAEVSGWDWAAGSVPLPKIAETHTVEK